MIIIYLNCNNFHIKSRLIHYVTLKAFSVVAHGNVRKQHSMLKKCLVTLKLRFREQKGFYWEKIQEVNIVKVFC